MLNAYPNDFDGAFDLASQRLNVAATPAFTVRNAAADAVVDRVDAGAAAGYMEIRTSGDAVLATITLVEPTLPECLTVL